ncbi:MAG: alpha/beta hydrolase-fold protein, partial [Bryobacter sp.]|nr:alpha/beta hydrolase-fold protein [Bryobacter sp.]
MLLAQAPAPVRSPELGASGEVTFRLRAPHAQEVLLSREGAQRVAMQKGENGVWSLTLTGLAPDYYGYSFIVDGVAHVDPANPLRKPNLLNTSSLVEMPANPAHPWEVQDVPRGTVHHHFYKSAIVGDHRDFYVYTPPGYNGKRKLPVLYLLHGFSDAANGWTAVGRAHVIFDNLLAAKQMEPMIVVMPLGYGAPEILNPSLNRREIGLFERNRNRFAESLLNEVLPQVEREYAVDARRDKRAIAGLSMGGAQSLYIGLNHLDRFSYIGAFSSGGNSSDFRATFPQLNEASNKQIRRLWIACGKDDFLF